MTLLGQVEGEYPEMKEVLRALSADIEYTGELGRDAVEEANEVARDTILFLPFVE